MVRVPAGHTIVVLRDAENGWLIAGTFGGSTEARISPFDADALDPGTPWDITPAPAP